MPAEPDLHAVARRPVPPGAAAWVIAGGVCAALHVGKLAPAIAALQAALGMTLVQAGFLLSAVQVAGMLLGVAFGGLADGLGGRRSMLLGLWLLVAASGAGAFASDVGPLLGLRVLEGFGFLLVVLPAPGLLRQWAPPARLHRVLGVWSAYMPLATALALLLGPLAIHALGWRAWWGGLAVLTAGMALGLARGLPHGLTPRRTGPARRRSQGRGPVVGAALDAVAAWSRRLRQTLGAAGPWLVALSFGLYAGQWLSVIGFLPTIYASAGVGTAATAVLTAAVAAVNIAGNLASGRLLQRGGSPTRLLGGGFLLMALAATAAFAGPGDSGLSPALRYAAVLLFSAVGGVIPGTLFNLAVRVAPSEHTLASTIGWMQQGSSLGQFALPPIVAWVASTASGWHLTPLVTGLCALGGLLLTLPLARLLARSPSRPSPSRDHR